jgi:Arc/MetJ-type ribon-helix-helix transcriptional regulator
MMNKTETIELPIELIDKIGDRVDRSDFETVDEYVSYVMERILDLVENENDKEIQDNIHDRLESLGYLNE